MNAWFMFATSAEGSAIFSIVAWATRRTMLNMHKKALKQMQTALWNDRQLRAGRMPGQEVKRNV